jgi:hypothetical protein
MAKCILPPKNPWRFATKKTALLRDLHGILQKIRSHDGKSLRNLSLGSGIFIGISFAHHFRKRLHDDEWTIFRLRRCRLMAGALDQRYFLRKTMFISMVFPI